MALSATSRNAPMAASLSSRAEQYRALAAQCLEWARDSNDEDTARAYLDLERQWLNEASALDGLEAVRSPDRAPTKSY